MQGIRGAGRGVEDEGEVEALSCDLAFYLSLSLSCLPFFFRYYLSLSSPVAAPSSKALGISFHRGLKIRVDKS